MRPSRIVKTCAKRGVDAPPGRPLDAAVAPDRDEAVVARGQQLLGLDADVVVGEDPPPDLLEHRPRPGVAAADVERHPGAHVADEVLVQEVVLESTL
jgi:hypothetical protein